MFLGVALYSLSLLAQLIAALVALSLFLRSKSYRLVCVLLVVGLIFLFGESALKIREGYSIGHFHMLDSWLMFTASFFLLLGIIQFKKLSIELETKNFILERLSKTDALTSALSRSEAIFRAELEVKKAFRSKESVAFLMLDIDHFKAVNDSFGHPIGDQVLLSLVSVCKKELREIDVFGRVGGEEFLIVLPNTDRSDGIEAAERLRSHIARQTCITASDKPIFITVSIGVSIFDPQKDKATDASAVMQHYYGLCDAAMYEAKQAGRNRVCISPH
jgi:diguanylate cyclase (GGDEF)-like protein